MKTRLIEMAYALNELNKINEYKELYESGISIIKLNSERDYIKIFISIPISKGWYDSIDLFFNNSKIEILDISKDSKSLPKEVGTILEVIQEKDIKTMIIDNLDLW